MKINVIVCYKPKSNSARIVSSTINKFEELRPVNFNISRVNIDKINLCKYITKNKLNNAIIYIYEADAKRHPELIEKMKRSNVKIMYYNNSVWYIPERVPGNKLKTNNYYLYDKIMYEAKNNFKLIKAHKVNPYTQEINEVSVSPFDIEDKLARRLSQSFYVYKSEQEAKNKIKEICEIHINSLNERIEKLNEQISKLEDEKVKYKNKMKEVI